MIRTTEPYYRRTLRLKCIVEGNKETMQDIISVFRHVYLEERLPKRVLAIGRGSDHSFFSIGRTHDPENPGRAVYLGLRLKKDILFAFGRYEKIFAAQFGAYERAYMCEIPPPYFVLAATYRLPSKNSKVVGGIVTEDVSHANTVQIYAPFNEEYIERTMEERRGRFFVDPNDGGQGFENTGAKYLEDRARIDV